jgi:hypothetical protein
VLMVRLLSPVFPHSMTNHKTQLISIKLFSILFCEWLNTQKVYSFRENCSYQILFK